MIVRSANREEGRYPHVGQAHRVEHPDCGIGDLGAPLVDPYHQRGGRRKPIAVRTLADALFRREMYPDLVDVGDVHAPHLSWRTVSYDFHHVPDRGDLGAAGGRRVPWRACRAFAREYFASAGRTSSATMATSVTVRKPVSMDQLGPPFMAP